VPERWVINASPLIVLAKAGQDSLLFKLADEIVIPHAVADEIVAGLPTDPARHLVEAGRIPIVATPATPIELAAWDLGAGETEVLSFAWANPGWSAIVDDGVARKCAAGFSIPRKGTLAIVLLAKRRSLIASAAVVLRTDIPHTCC
jgi:predicted nucleic acid-binding protein